MSVCICCGKDFKPFSASKGLYCSKKCQMDHKVQLNFLDWYYGTSHNIKNSTVRNYLTILYGYKCSICNISEWCGNTLVLEVEHIDGDSSNNLKENVCLLCPNCHSQTSTFKGRNKGNGRFTRAQRYRDGKSY